MGSMVRLKIYGSNAEEASIEAIERINEIDNKMSVNIDDSEVNKVNSSAGEKAKIVSEETYNVIEKAIEYSELTQGAFDITIGPVVALWGIGTDKQQVPSEQQVSEAISLLNYKNVILDENKKTVKLKVKNASIDLGGIAKGYAVDEINKIFHENKIESAFISIGGSSTYVKGNKPDGNPWRIGIQNPMEKRGEYIGVLSISDKAVVTSGNYERYFVQDGKRYHHIFDPKTGYPSESKLAGTTIISDYSIDGDVLSTSVYIMGLDKGIELIESLEGVDAVFITKDKRVYSTSGIKDKFKITDKEFDYEKGR